MIEFRVCWNAGSNVTFKGNTDWMEWEGHEDDTEDVVERDLTAVDQIRLPDGLEYALEGSGFDWWVETREVES